MGGEVSTQIKLLCMDTHGMCGWWAHRMVGEGSVGRACFYLFNKILCHPM